MKPLARQRLRRLRRSDPAKPEPLLVANGLVTRIEPFYKIARELPPLFERHWRELCEHQDTIPMAVNWDLFFNQALAGILHVHTVRRGDILVGFIFNVVGPHVNFATTLHAGIERFWLDPAYRKGWFAYRWFRTNDAYLQTLGVKRTLVEVVNGFMNARVGLIFKRLGYKPIETTWEKVNG